MDLTDTQLRNLRWLVQHGGSGYLDRYGRLVAGGEVGSQGSWVSWMNLLSKGCIAGGEGRITVTEYGMRHAKPTVSKGTSLP